MNTPAQDQRLKIALLVAAFGCMIFLPAVFYYGISAIFILASVGGALIYLSAVFRSRANRELCWGRGSRIPMTRFSCLVTAALFGCVAAYFVIRDFFKTTDTHCLTITFFILAILSVASRWLDMRRCR
jgi:hypothetical protein